MNTYHWFAVRPFSENKGKAIVELLEELGVSYYRPYTLSLVRNNEVNDDRPNQPFFIYKVDVSATYENSFIFFFSTVEYTKNILRKLFFSLGLLYGEMTDGKWRPTVTPLHQLERFQQILSIGGYYRILDDPITPFKKGKRVRVTDGKYKNFCGVIYRIKRQKHLIIRIFKGCVVMLEYIPTMFLQELPDTDNSHNELHNESNYLNYNTPDGENILINPFNVSTDYMTDEDKDFNLNISRIAIAIRQLSIPKQNDISQQTCIEVVNTLDEVLSLCPIIKGLDTRLGFGIGDKKSKASSSIKDIRQSFLSHIEKAAESTKQDFRRESMIKEIVAKILQCVANLKELCDTVDRDGATSQEGKALYSNIY